MIFCHFPIEIPIKNEKWPLTPSYLSIILKIVLWAHFTNSHAVLRGLSDFLKIRILEQAIGQSKKSQNWSLWPTEYDKGWWCSMFRLRKVRTLPMERDGANMFFIVFSVVHFSYCQIYLIQIWKTFNIGALQTDKTFNHPWTMNWILNEMWKGNSGETLRGIWDSISSTSSTSRNTPLCLMYIEPT